MTDVHDLTKYGAPYMLTDKGAHYYKTLANQYLQGLTINNDSLIKLFGLGIYSCNVASETDVDTEHQINNEIKEKLDLDMMKGTYNQQVKAWLLQNGYLKDNPDYDEEFSNNILEQLEEK